MKSKRLNVHCIAAIRDLRDFYGYDLTADKSGSEVCACKKYNPRMENEKALCTFVMACQITIAAARSVRESWMCPEIVMESQTLISASD